MLKKQQSQQQSGFTIVELLIVIIVIAILAAISIVAYNGIQGRGQVSKVQSDIKSIHKFIELYKVDNGNYPVSGDSGLAWGFSSTDPTSYVPGIVPKYASALPQIDPGANGVDGKYLYKSDGTRYMIMRHHSNGVPSHEWGQVPSEWKQGSLTDRYGIWNAAY